VLEPSPPADQDPTWFADDPTDPAGVSPQVLVTPIPGEGSTWTDIGADDPRVAEFARAHWLDGRRRLHPLPDGYDTGRRALHQIAFFAVAPKRYSVTGKLGLRYTHGGFGTPFYRDAEGADEQVRVEGDLLVRQIGEEVRFEPVSTAGAAAAFLGIEHRDTWFEEFHDPLDPVAPDESLRVIPEVTDAVGDWFGFSTHVLERARRTSGAADVSRVQLWPEHFDPAFEMGSSERGQRAGYGASPGDDAHPEPYLYVSPWGVVDRSDSYWNETAFAGSSLGYAELLQADDPYAAALEFYRGAYERLSSGT
jgi:hypothetical protein